MEPGQAMHPVQSPCASVPAAGAAHLVVYTEMLCLKKVGALMVNSDM
jgi:hypothetical protein